jgi:hypothetical protein
MIRLSPSRSASRSARLQASRNPRPSSRADWGVDPNRDAVAVTAEIEYTVVAIRLRRDGQMRFSNAWV